MRVLSLIEEIRCDNEIRQSEACSELAEMLLLGNEESLPNFPIRELILCLIALLNKDHNFELVSPQHKTLLTLLYCLDVERLSLFDKSAGGFASITQRSGRNYSGFVAETQTN
jgi:hypothetical protein